MRREHSRRLRFESLEDRQLLSVSSSYLSTLRDTWSNFILDDVHVIEIESADLSLAALKAALDSAKKTESDDLILVHTTADANRISYSALTDELIFDLDVETSGRVTLIADGTVPLTLDANSLCRVVSIKAASYVQLGNLIITGGLATTDLSGAAALYGQGGGIGNAGTLSLDRVQVKSNKADTGIFSDMNFGFNSAGGGIYNKGTLQIFRSTITDNTACSGKVNYWDTAAYGAGGGLFNASDAILELHQTTIANNTAESGIVTSGSSGGTKTLSVDITGQGGGLYNAGTATLTDSCCLDENSAWFGGGLYNNIFATATFNDSAVVNNKVDHSGGGIYNNQQGTVNIRQSVIQGNIAEKNGGGICLSGNLSLVGSVISGNISGADGGGLCYNGDYSENIAVAVLDIVNSTITGNTSGTQTAGAGGGIFFKGTSSTGKEFARVKLKNTIIVNNRIVKKTNPEDDLNLYVFGTCDGFYSLTTFQLWTTSIGNTLYNSSIPLFICDYDFTTGTEGNYQLVLDSESQAIDRGNNSLAYAAGLDSASVDLAHHSRIQNNVIDLGAYEYQPTPFDAVFPSRLSIQQGCSFELQCEGTDTNGNAFTKYLVDFNGDGLFDICGDELWLTWQNLYHRDYETGYFWLAVENSIGERSETRQIGVCVDKVDPCLSETVTELLDHQILKLALVVQSYTPLQQWTLDWGDDSEPTILHSRVDMQTFVHYYTPQATACTYSLSLTVTDINGGTNTFFLGYHTVSGTNAASYAALPNLITHSETSQTEMLESGAITECLKNQEFLSISARPPVVKIPPVVNESLFFERGTFFNIARMTTTGTARGIKGINTTSPIPATFGKAETSLKNSTSLFFETILFDIDDDNDNNEDNDKDDKTDESSCNDTSNTETVSRIAFALLDEDFFETMI